MNTTATTWGSGPLYWALSNRTYAVNVLKVDIVQTNLDGHVYCTNCVPFNLTPDSWTNVTWSISPYLGTNGAQFTAGPYWTGTGTNVWQGTNVWVYSGPVTNLYTLTARAVELTNAADTATFDVLKPKFLDLNWLEATNETLHHTSAYQTNALVLRRADKFKVDAKLSKGFTNTCFDVWFQAVQNFDGTPKTNDVPAVAADLGVTDWYCKLLSVSNNTDQTKTANLEISIPSTNCPIGDFQWRALVTPKVSTNLVLDTTNFPGAVIILFNPWDIDDSVYMANAAERTEYVTRTSARIWGGANPWQYAQFSALTLEILLSKLGGLDATERADPIMVSSNLALVVRQSDAGILCGQWGEPYTGGTRPWLWTGTDQILTRYKATGSTVKYAQCFTFGGVLTSFLRCAGIPARTITNYSSPHDGNGDGNWDLYLKSDGTRDTAKTEAKWNYHVWCDAYMTRPDRPACDGWQAVDATYQIGPAPLSAVKANSHGAYDVDFVRYEVAAPTRTWKANALGVDIDRGLSATQAGTAIGTQSVGGNAWTSIKDQYK